VSASAQAPASPFKGLAAFQDTELDALLFYGREREREVVVANLLASRLTVLYGSSGVGKTSLLRAAVAHSLRSAHEAVVVLFSSWAGDPQSGLAAAIDEAAGIESEGTLVERLRAAAAAVGGDVYVILDQFEEYFLYHERNAFAAELAAAISEPGLRANFLLGLREDALAKLDAFKGQIPNLFANYLRLDHLDRAGARAAILGPVERYNELTGGNLRVEPELVEAVLDEVTAGRVDVGQAGRGGVEADEDRVEAPYLQLVLERLWEAERERGSTVLRLATLRELGDAEAIVRAHLQRALGRLAPSEQDVAATMFGHLVTPSGSKIAHRSGDLAQYAGVPEAEVRPVLDALGRERILRAVDGAGGGERYEIFHDVLADGVLAWRARRELERDRERAHARQRRLTVVAAVALVGLAAMTAVAIYAFTERSHARSSARKAHARALEATALAELPQNPRSALADAVKAARLSPSSRAAAVLRQALVADHSRRVLPAGGAVSAVAYDPRGKRMLAAASNGRVYLYLSDGSPERALGLGAPVTAASFSPNGHMVVAAAGRSAGLWDAASGKRLRELQLPGVATAVGFDKDGRLLLTTSARGAMVWRTATGRSIRTLRPRGSVRAGALSPDGRFAALIVQTGKRPRGLLFETRTGRLLHVLAPPTGLRTVEFSPNGRVLATAAYRGTYLWDPETGRRLQVLSDSKDPINDAEFSPNGSLLAVAGEDGATRVWRVVKGDRFFYFADHTNPVVAVAWSPDGRFVADASSDRTALVWQVNGVEQGREVGRLVGHSAGVTSVAFAPDGRSLLTGGADHTARLWDTRFEQDLQVLGSHRGGAVTASFGAGGRLAVSAGADGKARIWDVRARRLLHVLRVGRRVADARLSPDGRLVVTAGPSGAALWDARRGARLRTLVNEPVLVARFSPDGTVVVTGGLNGRAQLWRARDGSLVATEKQAGAVEDAAFTPDGKTVATAGADGVSVWPTKGGHRRLLRSPDSVSRVAFSPDGSLVAAAGLDGTARLWEVAGGRVRHVLEASTRPLTDVVFSPDGRLLLTTGLGLKDAETWDVRTGKPRQVLVGHFGTVSTGAFSPDSQWVVTAGPTTAGLWRTDSGHPYFYLRGDTKLLTSVAFSPDGRYVLSASNDGSVRLYRCEVCGNLDQLVASAERRLAASR
jgi:WD40 repeat protein